MSALAHARVTARVAVYTPGRAGSVKHRANGCKDAIAARQHGIARCLRRGEGAGSSDPHRERGKAQDKKQGRSPAVGARSTGATRNATKPHHVLGQALAVQ